MTTYKLLLINPKRNYRYNWDMNEVTKVMGKVNVSLPLSLPLLAALTPKNWTVEIADENVKPLPKNPDFDLIGITGFINNIQRAYDIADMYRSMGKTVCMGGPQVSVSAEKSLQHADFVVLNEAEDIWQTALADFEKGTLKTIYKSEEFNDFRYSPVPRWDLVNTDNYMSFSVQVSRGCPYSCEFCVVRDLFGKKQRYRDLENVVAEIKSLPPQAVISFADDNLTANRTYLREFLKEMKTLKRSWSCQASIDIAYDKDFIRDLAEAGCNSLLIGFETLDPETIKNIGKLQNKVEKYKEAIQNIHDAGMHVIASFVVGFDTDTKETLENIFQFTQDNNLSYIMINALAAYTGSTFEKKMLEQGRTYDYKPDFANGIFPTLDYVNFTQEEMFEGILSTLERIYDFDNLIEKTTRLFSTGSFLNSFEGNEVSFKVKYKTSKLFLLRYILSPDKKARKYFWHMIELIKTKKASPNAIIQYLLFIESFRGYLRSCRKQEKTVMKILRERDRVKGVKV